MSFPTIRRQKPLLTTGNNNAEATMECLRLYFPGRPQHFWRSDLRNNVVTSLTVSVRSAGVHLERGVADTLAAGVDFALVGMGDGAGRRILTV